MQRAEPPSADFSGRPTELSRDSHADVAYTPGAMNVLLAMVSGVLLGFALAVYPGSAFRRLLTCETGPFLRRAGQAVWPLLVLDLGGLVLCWLVTVVWMPARPLPAGILALPLLVWLLWRGWFLVEISAATLFLEDEDARPAPSARFLLLRPIRGPQHLLVRIALSYPATLALVSSGEGVFWGLLAGWAAGYFCAHAILGWKQTRHRSGDPYLVRPNVGRIALSMAGLTFFACAFFIVILTGLRTLTLA